MSTTSDKQKSGGEQTGSDKQKSWLQRITQYWNLIADGAAVILGIVGTFLYPPPPEIAKDNEQWLGFARFIIAVLIGLMFVLSLLWNRKKHTKIWWATSFITLILSIGAFFSYNYFSNQWTCRCFSGRVVIGRAAEKTQLGNRSNADAACKDLLQENSCDAEQIWLADSIKLNRFLLAAMYIACVPLFSICIVSLIQSIFCMTRDDENREDIDTPTTASNISGSATVTN
jgi:cation transport ATPase